MLAAHRALKSAIACSRVVEYPYSELTVEFHAPLSSDAHEHEYCRPLLWPEVRVALVYKADRASGIERVGVENLLVLLATRAAGRLFTGSCDNPDRWSVGAGSETKESGGTGRTSGTWRTSRAWRTSGTGRTSGTWRTSGAWRTSGTGRTSLTLCWRLPVPPRRQSQRRE